MQQLEPDTSFSNRPLAVSLEGLLDQQVLIQCLSTILQRHEALRTVFPVKNGEPVQQILAAWTLTPVVIDLRSLPQQQRETEARKLESIFENVYSKSRSFRIFEKGENRMILGEKY